MTDLQIIPAEERHLEAVKRSMRREGAKDALAIGLEPGAALGASAAASALVLAVEVAGVTLAVFGVAKDGPRWTVWCVTTTCVTGHWLAFARASRVVFDSLLDRFGQVSNYIHVDNVRTKRWIEWLGCEIGDPVPLGPQGALFYPFTAGGHT